MNDSLWSRDQVQGEIKRDSFTLAAVRSRASQFAIRSKGSVPCENDLTRGDMIRWPSKAKEQRVPRRCDVFFK